MKEKNKNLSLFFFTPSLQSVECVYVFSLECYLYTHSTDASTLVERLSWLRNKRLTRQFSAMARRDDEPISFCYGCWLLFSWYWIFPFFFPFQISNVGRTGRQRKTSKNRMRLHFDYIDSGQEMKLPRWYSKLKLNNGTCAHRDQFTSTNTSNLLSLSLSIFPASFCRIKMV